MLVKDERAESAEDDESNADDEETDSSSWSSSDSSSSEEEDVVSEEEEGRLEILSEGETEAEESESVLASLLVVDGLIMRGTE